MSLQSGTIHTGGGQRHRAREFALQILYRFEIEPPEASSLTIAGLSSELRHHFEHFKVPDELREFTGHLVAGTLLAKDEIDPLLEKQSPTWKLARMPIIDRSLLRMATYELRGEADTPASVVIDEAVELAKTFGTQETPAFVNGVLDALRKTLRP